MFLAFSQQDGRAPFLDHLDHLIADEPVSGLIIRQFSAEVVELHSFVAMRLAQRSECRRTNEDMMLEWSSDRLPFRIHAMANRSALHEHDGMMAVFACNCRSQAREVLCLCTTRYLLEAVRGEMVAFVDDNLTVVGDAIVNSPFAHEALKQRNIQHSGKFLSSTSNSTYRFLRQVEKITKSLKPLIEQLLSVHQYERTDVGVVRPARRQ